MGLQSETQRLEKLPRTTQQSQRYTWVRRPTKMDSTWARQDSTETPHSPLKTCKRWATHKHRLTRCSRSLLSAKQSTSKTVRRCKPPQPTMQTVKPTRLYKKKTSNYMKRSLNSNRPTTKAKKRTLGSRPKSKSLRRRMRGRSARSRTSTLKISL